MRGVGVVVDGVEMAGDVYDPGGLFAGNPLSQGILCKNRFEWVVGAVMRFHIQTKICVKSGGCVPLAQMDNASAF